MAIMDLFYIHFFCAPFSACLYELSPLQASFVSVQNHNVEIYREYIYCVDIVWRSENQNKTNEEHSRCKQFRNNADTLCFKPFWMSFHGNLIDKMLFKVMIDPTFYVLGC